MPGWTLVDTHPTQGRVFQRPLDVTELCFLWDGFFNGTADSSHHYELRLFNGARDAHLFSEANIARAWVSTKRRFPLAGALVRGADNAPLRVATDSKADDSSGFASEPHFIVREHDLAVLRPCDIVFGQVTDAEEAQQHAAAILQGPRLLSEESLVQLHVFRETGAERTDVLHLMILVAHCVTDGTATRTFARCLLDTLARGGGPESGQVPLEERLAMAISLVDLEPGHLCSLSPGIRRWRRAIGTVIFQLRMNMTQGGHTLPCRLTRSTPHTAARPGVVVSTSLTPAQTVVVIASCRLHGITFGNAYLALAQVAMTRVLYRRYLRGEISEEEWTYRRRQPHINGGPLSLRRYLDKAWFENGGGGEFMLCSSLYIYQLPFMTLGSTAERHKNVLSDGAPPFPDLLSFDRFLHRARLVKKQATSLFNHPLFLELTRAAYLDYIRITRLRALRWMQRTETAAVHGTHNSDEDKVLAVTDNPTVWAHGGSSLGNVDLMSPSEYPLPPIHPLSPFCPTPHPAKAGYVTPPPPSDSEAETMAKIAVENLRVHLHTPPAELYLGANTSRGRMNMFVHYDGNVFEEGIVREWLDEVREAVLWYLGRTQ
ncbi:hypothetical protein L210DRAFT_2198980 [Boletus edulis BED1]|uniref:Uncharacterized protein n=1 Tax=Boletus edulis BED1 TaxID=1328754 RepID=A0AAD4GFQ7_BOLED|nr:hypothetical protein L210DRAFT_2198980 [Boletus edulis BED1]